MERFYFASLLNLGFSREIASIVGFVLACLNYFRNSLANWVVSPQGIKVIILVFFHGPLIIYLYKYDIGYF